MSKEKLRVTVTGGRDYNDYYNVQRALAKVSARFDIAVSYWPDQATGRLAKIWCDRTGTPCAPFEPGHTRPQLALIFPDDPTSAAFFYENAGIPVKIIPARVLENDCA